ncbi:MarR family winged helix-turn-helix transcriptional regulator [Kineococcus sp. SYSU DK004]|uniref:MarR family winged helix-turn-helix transcriptional regulator n=1 Tax=Kineococcus sp. SYSU DK004 TaxID=3383125 RepID=UPI003D7C3E93
MGGAAPGAGALRLLRAAAETETRLAAALVDGLPDRALTVDRWRVLQHVAAHPGASMSDVCAALALAPATATRAVDGLVDTACLYREADAGDRRRVVLRPSRRGLDVLRAVAPAVAHVEGDLRGVLGDLLADRLP